MKYERSSSPREKSFLDRAEALMRTATTVDELITCWTASQENKMKLGTGFNDSGRHEYLWIQLSDGERNEADFYVPLTAVRTMYPNARALENYISLKRKDGIPRLRIDEQKFDRYSGVSPDTCYDDVLCSPVLSLSQAMPTILAYSCSQAGEVSLSAIEPELLCEDEPEVQERYLSRKLLQAFFTYESPKVTSGCRPMLCESLYIEPVSH